MRLGKLTASTGSLVNPFQYTARESDTETGLYYYLARYYDPSAGRFLSEDPIGFLSGIDFYTYVRNGPTKYRDPSGKDPIIGVTVGAIAGTVQGALGAALAGGSGKEIIVAALIGGGAGAAIGLIDPTAGIGTLAIIGGAAGGVGDVIGQLITGAGTRCKPFNYGSTVGAVVGGAFAGAGGAAVSLSAEGIAESERAITAAGAAITSGPAIFPPVIGAKLGERGKPADCGCEK